MEVFLASLLIVGCTATSPSLKYIIEDLRTQLDHKIEDIQAHAKQLNKQTFAHIKENVPAFLQNPLRDSAGLVKDLTKDAGDVIFSTISDITKVNEFIMTVIEELDQFDAELMETLKNLMQQLIEATTEAISNRGQLLKQILYHGMADVWAVLLDPASSQKVIEEYASQDFNLYVSHVNQFNDKVMKAVVEAFEIINVLIQDPIDS